MLISIYVLPETVVCTLLLVRMGMPALLGVPAQGKLSGVIDLVLLSISDTLVLVNMIINISIFFTYT